MRCTTAAARAGRPKALPALALLTLAAVGLAPPPASGEDRQQEYLSVRVDVWSKQLRTMEEDGSARKLKIALAAAVYRFRAFDELFDSDAELVNSVGVRPKLEFEYRTPITNVSFVPELELALNRSLDTSNKVLSGAASAGLLHRRNGDARDIRTRIRIRYGTEYELDGLNFDDYLELSLEVLLREQRGFRAGRRDLTITPFAEVRRFADSLEFRSAGGAVFDVETQYEIGLAFNTHPRKKILGVALPRLKLSYVFGDGFRGVKIRL